MTQIHVKQMERKMVWIDIRIQTPDENRVQFLTNGKTVFMKGNKLNPFFLLIYGEFTTICDFHATHWITLPDLSGL